MAEDLSQTIQAGLAQTLTDLLGTDAKFKETTKADRRDLQNMQLLQVNSEFEFDKVSTVLEFFIPANSASIIFNTMMGASDFEISDVMDDDTTDAMGEFISNVSGSLVTAFNAKEVADLGKSKFHIQHKEIIGGSSLEDIENIFRFVIELDEQLLIVFMKFGEEFLPFVQEISQAEPTPYPETELPSPQEEPLEEIVEEEPQEPIVEETSAPTAPIDKTSIPENTEDSSKEEENDDTQEENEEDQKKSKKMKLLIIGVASLIVIILIVIITLFFTGSDEEEVEQTQNQQNTMKEESKNTQEPQVKEIETTTTKKSNTIDFNIKDINIERLNERLATLTKYEILTKEELERQKFEEAKRLEQLQKEKELIEFAKKNKEEPLKIAPPQPQNEAPKIKEPEKIIPIIKQKETTEEKKIEIQEPQEEPKLPEVQKETMDDPTIEQQKTTETKAPAPKVNNLFVVTNSIKYTLFKNLVTQTGSNTARISMCNDKDGRTAILIGPFEDNERVNAMIGSIANSGENITSSVQQLTKEEFNQRCNF